MTFKRNDVHPTIFQAESRNRLGHGLRREVFFLNLEDGYFGCQVNESTDVLQLLELSKLCDSRTDCYQGVDEQRSRLKCTGELSVRKTYPFDKLEFIRVSFSRIQCHCEAIVYLMKEVSKEEDIA